MIKKQGNKYIIKSKDGKKKLGEYNTRSEAVKRLGQIEYFKNKSNFEDGGVYSNKFNALKKLLKGSNDKRR